MRREFHVRFCEGGEVQPLSATRLVIMMRGRVEPTRAKVEELLEELALKVNPDKTRVVDAREKRFDFLGFSFQRPRSSKNGKMIVVVEPSRKSEQLFREEVRALTARWTHRMPQNEVIERVNQYVRGWVNYFHVHNSTRVFARQRFFLEQRLRKYLQKRRQRRGHGLMQWPSSRLYQELGLYAIPVYAKYRRPRML
jgi:RNA-directed DNA polymerase